MKNNLVICNKSKTCTEKCEHWFPHEKINNPYKWNNNNEYCTEWGVCIAYDYGKETKIRCISYKEE